MTLAIILVLLCIYITVEVFIMFWKMHNGDRICRLAKYFGSLLVAWLGLLCVFPGDKTAESLWLIPDITVALFLWPSTYARFTGGFKNRIGD